jgi:arylsulfatase A-like enzyme
MVSSLCSAAARRPNILFAIADDMGHASAYGTRWVKTPAFDKLASNGILFTNAYTPNAKCAPSRSCILTGRNPWQLEEAANHQPAYPAKFKSWVEAFADGGYFTGYTGKGWAPGKMPKERAMITGKLYDSAKLASRPADGINKLDYFSNFKQFMSERPDGEPFCFWYGAREPHRGYEFKSGQNKGGYKLADIDKVPAYWPDTEDVRHDMLDYAMEVEHFDTHLGKMIAYLEENGMLENTIIIATSDNGPPFPRMKGHPFEDSCKLPLAIMWDKGIKKPGRISSALVSFIDFAPTFLEAGSIKQKETGMQPIQGSSLFDIFAGKDIDRVLPQRKAIYLGRERNDVNIRPGAPSGLGFPVRAIRKENLLYLYNFAPDRWPCGTPESKFRDTDNSPTKRAIESSGEDSRVWQFCFGFRPREELYDLKNDSNCVKNLAGDPKHKKTLANLKKELFAELKVQKDPRVMGNGDIFDNYISPRQKTKKVTSKGKS